MKQDRVELAVAGAGLIGRQHIDRIIREPTARLTAIVDPAPGAAEIASRHDVAYYPDLRSLFLGRRPQGVVVATPNQLHIQHGLECVAAGVPALIEKPLADDPAAATHLVETAEQAAVPLLTGHHRRYNPLIRQAKATIDEGGIGRIIAAHAICWFYKPDGYFEQEWRRRPGAGPVFLNLIHDIDLLRHLCGEVSSVQAAESNAVRGNPVEETAAIMLRFASGALGTVSVSDTIVSPWSWELTSRENGLYHPSGEECYLIGGTHGSLSIPGLSLWRNPDRRSWWEPLDRNRLAAEADDPLSLQIRHFCAVIRGEAPPLVSGREGLETLKVITAVKQAAKTGRSVSLQQGWS